MAAARPFWLCADDYGISPAVNTAIRDLVVRGRLNATSAMVVAPSLPRSQAVALSALNSTAHRVAIGLHITLTAPFVPLSKHFGPLRDGAFLPLSEMVRTALLRRLDEAILRTEVASQVEAFQQLFGRAPAFVDGHHHVQLLPQVDDALLAVVKEAAPDAWVRQCGRAMPFAAPGFSVKAFLLDLGSWRFRRRAAARGVVTNPAFAGAYRFDGDVDFAKLFSDFLHGLPESSVVMCHPGFVDDELRRLDPLTTLREKEYAFLASDEFAALLAGNGLTLAQN